MEEESREVCEAITLGVAPNERDVRGLAETERVHIDDFVVDGEPDTLGEVETRADALGQEVELLDAKVDPVPPITPVTDTKGEIVTSPLTEGHMEEVEDGVKRVVVVREFKGDRDTDTLTDTLADELLSPPVAVKDWE